MAIFLLWGFKAQIYFERNMIHEASCWAERALQNFTLFSEKQLSIGLGLVFCLMVRPHHHHQFPLFVLFCFVFFFFLDSFPFLFSFGTRK
jgi:hypothetical protein